jgi:RES domain-containing protein
LNFAALVGSLGFYRAHTPRWASEPLSGAGAARQGGRPNRAGVHALYLATSQETAIAEYQASRSCRSSPWRLAT